MLTTHTFLNADQPLFCLLGPTAAGKSHLAHQLALEFNASNSKHLEIISLDSALIYKGMNIGTAKPSIQEQQQVTYHLIDICDILQIYNVNQFIQDLQRSIELIKHRGNIPLLVGGTMMYYQALSRGLDALPEQNISIRADLEAQAQIHGWQHMHAQLSSIDPKSAEKIKPNDKQRIERALEVYLITGKPMSSLLGKATGMATYTCCLQTHRPALHALIEQRFNTMLNQGFIEEVQQLQQAYPQWSDSHTSQRLVGYRQALNYLKHHNLKQLQEEGISATRQLAKRQNTWLRQLSKQEVVYEIEIPNYLNSALNTSLEHGYAQLKSYFSVYYHTYFK